jgi:error-prone DNA polymerase
LPPRRLAELPEYAELHCRSNHSFLTGASHPEELAARAHALGYAALAVTDECSLGGVVRAHGQARSLGLHFIVGAEMKLSRSADPAAPSSAGPRLVLLAMSRRGYGNLSQWITVARRRAPKGQYQALMSDLEGRVPHLPTLAGLPDCLALLHTPEVLACEQPFETLFAHALWQHKGGQS